MSYRYHGRASVDPSSPRAFGVCDRCGTWINHHTMEWQYEYAGTTVINTGSLVCGVCLDDMQTQLKTLIIPPDPRPVLNARVEPFTLDESDWLATQDGDRITTQDDELIITQIPNPASDPENPT